MISFIFAGVHIIIAGSYVLRQFQWFARVHLSVNFWHIYFKIKWRDKNRDEGYNVAQENGKL